MKLASKSKSRVATLRDELAVILATTLKATGNLEALKADEEKRNREIDALEGGVAYDDEATVGNLETKKAQLGLLRAKIERIEQNSVDAFNTLNSYMQPIHNDLAAALEPSWREMVFEIARTMLPWENDWAASLRKATQTRKAQESAHQLLGRRYGSGANPIGEARHVLKILDTLLAGEDPFVWTAEEPPKTSSLSFPWE